MRPEGQTTVAMTLSSKPLRVPLFIRVKPGSPVLACCPTIPGLCVIGATVTEVTRGVRQRVRDALLADPTLLDGTCVTFLTLDVLSDQVENGVVLDGALPVEEQ
ncbi:MAG: hypothetical protein HYY25_11980 [Candidatus Wallbacteria bacterium]|nr:hypothetical protein [Candidatus Wallbacteria bacterium]